MYAESYHHDKVMLCVNNNSTWLLNNNFHINSSKNALKLFFF